jgi:hypothetical protein
MNDTFAGWKRFFLVGLLTLLTVPVLQAADETNSANEAVLPLENIRRFESTRYHNTTLQDEQVTQALTGKRYQGSVVVMDVRETSNAVVKGLSIPFSGIVIYGESGAFAYYVADGKLKAKAAELRKGDLILVTARLWNIAPFGNNTFKFDDVQSLEVQPPVPTDQSPPETTRHHPQWEYKIIVSTGTGDLQNQLDQLGKQGWELVSENEGRVFYLKRLVQH